MINQAHTIVLNKLAIRALQEKVINSNVKNVLESVNTKSLAVRGWELAASPVSEYRPDLCWRQRDHVALDGDDRNKYEYEMRLTATYTRQDDKPAGSQDLASILRTVHQRASQPAFGSWTVTSIDGESYTPPTDGEVSYSSDLIGYAEVAVPEDFEDHFSHLFGLDSHVARIRGALEAGIMSNWHNRYHCALQGPPGCGKSDICQSLKRALGDDAVMEFDATATTAAGAIKELSEREILPRIMIVEEIEKADEKALSFLLGVCDLRGEIRKTTARNTIQRDTKVFVVCTVNNVELFNKLNAGALASRFANKVWFKRPSRDMLQQILLREIGKVNGDVDWIEPTLNYADANGISDPRQITALCLCGRDLWLTGEYQIMLSETGNPDEIESPI